jgi:hypothetical protein
MLYAFDLHLQSARKAPKRTTTATFYNRFCNSYEQHFPIKQSEHEFIARPRVQDNLSYILLTNFKGQIQMVQCIYVADVQSKF